MISKKIANSVACGVAALMLSPLCGWAQTGMTGDMAGGGTMNGMGAMPMTGDAMPMGAMAMSGTVSRRYVDAQGNVTAIDVLTPSGVRMVRLSPAIPAGDERLRTTFRTGAMMSMEGMMMGPMNTPTYDPNAPLQSGLLMSTSSLPASANASGPIPGTMGAQGMAGSGLGAIRALVRLRNGRVAVVKETNGGLMLIDASTHRMTPVTMSNGQLSLPGIRGARVTMVNPDGTLMQTNPAGMTGGMTGGAAMTGAGAMSMTGGRIMMVMADGAQMPVTFTDGRAMVMMPDGTTTELLMQNGKYVVPEAMTGARMMMVMPDGRMMSMDTVDGRLMMMMPDGTMTPVDTNAMTNGAMR